MSGGHHRLSVRVTGLLLMVLLSGILVEGTARIAFAFKDRIKSWLGVTTVPVLSLDEYEEVDPQRPGQWRLRAGYSRTLEELIEEKRRAGKSLAVEHLTAAAARLGVADHEPLMRINQAGFRGPELDTTGSRSRVLTLGDSCTFGTWFERYSYPRTLEREWRRAGLGIEVVNGGVEGYSPVNVLHRIEEFKALKPRLTTIYLGWNALDAEPAPLAEARTRYLKSPELLAKAFVALRRSAGAAGRDAVAAYGAARRPDRHARAVRRLEGYLPPFMGHIERIVTEMQSAGSVVVLVTLPGLYVMDEEPSAKAVALGHLPTFTDNPYVLAKLTERYNAALRELAGRRGLRVVDLDGWSRRALQPRDAWFMDSVHLHEEGQELIGRYMARELRAVVSASRGR